jgi:cytidylate kinase
MTMASQDDLRMKLRALTPAVIAVDGPAASGKSTVGFCLAKKIDFLFFDTGAMYRAVTWQALVDGQNVYDSSAIGGLAEKIEIDILPPGAGDQDGRHCSVLVEGNDVTVQLRRPDVDERVSEVSVHPRVRRALSDHQRRIGQRYGSGRAEKPGIVMVGRDIGTVVMPDAPVKVYLDASVEVRAQRRYAELVERGKSVTLEETREIVLHRDRIDSERALAPLRIAEGAHVIDTSELPPIEVVQEIIRLALAQVR